jgi:RNA polymerase sigma-70 factor, ECF subfamily
VPAEVSDEIVMAQLGEGSREALAILFRRYAHVVRSITYRAVRDRSEANDLVQDISLLVNRDARAFDCAKGSERSWILRIAHRRAISRHRYLISRHFYNRVDLDDVANQLGSLQMDVGQAVNPIEEMVGKSVFQRVFEELSPNQRETLRLHFFEGYFFEGYNLAEIAAKLGQSRGTSSINTFGLLKSYGNSSFPANCSPMHSVAPRLLSTRISRPCRDWRCRAPANQLLREVS